MANREVPSAFQEFKKFGEEHERATFDEDAKEVVIEPLSDNSTDIQIRVEGAKMDFGIGKRIIRVRILTLRTSSVMDVEGVTHGKYSVKLKGHNDGEMTTIHL